MANRRGWAVRIGSVGETQVRVHFTMLLLIGWYAWMGWQHAGSSGALDEVVFIVLLFVSVLFHEFGHIFAARYYGIGTPDVLLTPIGGVARIASLPAASGSRAGDRAGRTTRDARHRGRPRWHRSCSVASGVSTSVTGFLDLPLWSALLYTNVILLLFNLIPAFPMDGGRVLRALLAMRLGLVRGTRIAARVGQVIAGGFALFGITRSPILLLIAGFVFLGAQAELEAVQTGELADGLNAERLMIPELTPLPLDVSLDTAMRIAVQSGQPAFGVIDPDGRLGGVLTRDDLLRGIADAGLDAPLAAILQPIAAAGVIGAGASFDQVVERLQHAPHNLLPVVDDAGRFMGLITSEHVAALLTRERARRGLRAQ